MKRRIPDPHKATTMAQRYKFDLVLVRLREKGWRVYLEPTLRFIDDTWTLRLFSDRLDYLFVSESGQWERKRFTREPFGDYTVCYQPKGSGKDLESLLEHEGTSLYNVSSQG